MGGYWRSEVGAGGSVELFELALFELGIVSDLVECVHLDNLAVLEDRVQQVLEGGGHKADDDERSKMTD